MATKSKIVESSFRLGAGRYIQEDGAARRLGSELELLGCKRPYVIHGKRALAEAGERLREGLAQKEMEAEYYEYIGFCNPVLCESIVACESFRQCDAVVGVGGGNACDAAKLCAAMAGLPVITVPTSSATCAAYTPLSVMYDGEGHTVGTRHHLREVNAVLADMEILCRQPLRLFVAGIYDSLAKLVEIRQRLDGKSEAEIDIGLRSSYALSEFIYERLLADLPTACDDVSNGRNTKAVYDTVYNTVAVTGVISGLARGSNQTAIAHKVYETTRTLFPQEARDRLHGELVAIGLIPQLIYNGEEKKAAEFKRQLHLLGLPVSLAEAGISVNGESIRAYTDKIEASSALAGADGDELQRFRKAFLSICG